MITMSKIRALIELSRIDRFAGTMILFWPFAWSVTMSGFQFKIPLPDYIRILSVGFIGAILLHSGGCIWNDIIDRDLDAQVERCKRRPLPSGRVAVHEALLFVSVHIVLIFWMSRDLNNKAWWITFLTVVPFTGLYPFMKRITYFPQVWLGITLHLPVLLPPAVFVNIISTSSIFLFLGGCSWTMWYDTIYACQDKSDDRKAGVKTISLILGQHTRTALAIFASTLILSLIISGFLSGNGIWYFFVGAGGASYLLARDLATTDLNDPKDCLRAFENNGFGIGPIVFIGFLLDYLMC